MKVNLDALGHALQPHVRHGGMPRWPALAALLIIGAIYLVLSDRYRIGPPWLVLAVGVVLLIPRLISFVRGHRRVARALALVSVAMLTLAVASSAVLLLVQLPTGRIQALDLLLDATLIWWANIVAFALWYWEIDAGGPARRHPGRHCSADFLFPQQQADNGLVEGWSPSFLDYLFLAFNTSTAFSPTDTLVLSRPAKLLMMTQSFLSLVIIAGLVARAVNTLGPQSP